MALTINGEIIDPELIEQEFSGIKAHYESLAQVSCCDRDEEFRGYAKDNITARVLLAQEAEKQNPLINEEEVDAGLAQVIEENGGEEMFYLQVGLSPDQSHIIRDDIRANLQVDKLIESVCGADTDPTETEIEDYYKNHRDEFIQEVEVKASHIFKGIEQSEKRDEIYDEFRGVRQKLLDGANFDEMAESCTDKPTDEIDLGYFKRGEIMDEFEVIVFSMNVGEISPIFSTHWGFHLAKCTGRRGGDVQPLAEVKSTVRTQLIELSRKEKVDALIADLKAKATIEDNPTAD